MILVCPRVLKYVLMKRGEEAVLFINGACLTDFAIVAAVSTSLQVLLNGNFIALVTLIHRKRKGATIVERHNHRVPTQQPCLGD